MISAEAEGVVPTRSTSTGALGRPPNDVIAGRWWTRTSAGGAMISSDIAKNLVAVDGTLGFDIQGRPCGASRQSPPRELRSTVPTAP
jgi:hypothetical protein